MKTQKERDQEKRRQKLEHVQEQIDSGSLHVRKMTADERKRFPPREPKARKR